jgi:hypothetical protein
MILRGGLRLASSSSSSSSSSWCMVYAGCWLCVVVCLWCVLCWVVCAFNIYEIHVHDTHTHASNNVFSTHLVPATCKRPASGSAAYTHTQSTHRKNWKSRSRSTRRENENIYTRICNLHGEEGEWADYKGGLWEAERRHDDAESKMTQSRTSITAVSLPWYT